MKVEERKKMESRKKPILRAARFLKKTSTSSIELLNTMETSDEKQTINRKTLCNIFNEDFD